MIVGILKEPSFETRVSLLAESVAALIKKGITVIVENGAGEMAFCSDGDYIKAGAAVKKRSELINHSDILLSIHPPQDSEISSMNGKILVGVFNPLMNNDLVVLMADNKITTFSMDMLPRTTRAQSMDVLSSQANIAGYKAVLEAANAYSPLFPDVYDSCRKYCSGKSTDPRSRSCRFAGDCNSSKTWSRCRSFRYETCS